MNGITDGDYSLDEDDQLQPSDTLDDTDLNDVLDRGFSPPEHYSAGQRFGNTPYEEAVGESLDQRLAQEEPEPDPYAEPDDDFVDDGQVGGTRAGRLVDADQGGPVDTEKDLIGHDVGIDGAGASAEEAAMHVIDADSLDEVD